MSDQPTKTAPMYRLENNVGGVFEHGSWHESSVKDFLDREAKNLNKQHGPGTHWVAERGVGDQS